MKKDSSSGPPLDARPQDDSSSLFSLHELKARALAAAESSGKGKAQNENSGLIDIRALMDEAEREKNAKTEEQALRVSEHIGVYPFGSSASTPLVATAPVLGAEPAHRSIHVSSSRARLWGGALAGAVVAVGAVAFAAINSGASMRESLLLARPALSDVAERRMPLPVFGGAAAGQLVSGGSGSKVGELAEPAATASPDRPPKIGLHVPKAPVLNRAPTNAKPASGAPSGQAKPPAADPCRGDLLCAMQRAIKNQKK